MGEGLGAILALLGLLVFGIGGGSWFMARRRRKRSAGEAPIKVRALRPPDRVSVAPPPEEIERADVVAEATDGQIEAIEKEVEERDPPSASKPDPGVSEWLRNRAANPDD